MNKSTKIIILAIGVLSILAGVYGFFNNSESSVTYGGIFIGVILIGSLFINQKGTDKNEAE